MKLGHLIFTLKLAIGFTSFFGLLFVVACGKLIADRLKDRK